MVEATPFLVDSTKFMFGFSTCLAIFSGIELYSVLHLKINVTNAIAWTCILSSLVQSLMCTSLYVGWIGPSAAAISYTLFNWFFMTQSLPHLILNRYLFLNVNKYPKIWYHTALFLVMLPINVTGWYFWYSSYVVDYNKYILELEKLEYIHVVYFLIVDIYLNKIFLSKFQDVYLRQHKNMSTEIKRKIITPLIFIVISDLALVFTEFFIGDLYTTCVRGFTYSLKAYFEIAVVRLIVDTIRAKHGINMSTKVDASSSKEKTLAKVDASLSKEKTSKNLKSNPALES
jgi:hypothetical protein